MSYEPDDPPEDPEAEAIFDAVSDQVDEPMPVVLSGHEKRVVLEAVAAALLRRGEAQLTKELAAQVREKAVALYTEAADYALTKGIIIADTKFEFGQDDEGGLYLIDEALTPDSSRFWPADRYAPSSNPPSYDKQFVRDWLETQNWNKKAPAPVLPPDVLAKTAEKYEEALRRLVP